MLPLKVVTSAPGMATNYKLNPLVCPRN